MAELSVQTTRRYYWVCPRCFAHVPRPEPRCGCGGTKAERKRAHARVGAPPQPHWWVAAWLSLGTFGLLWLLLD